LSRATKSELKDEEFLCSYRLQHEPNKITLVADCKECNGEANLNNRTCLRGILNGLCQEYNVDSVILSHYIETKYAEESMHILRMMVEIVHDLEQMAIREPYEEYFANDDRLVQSFKSQQKAKCEKCDLKPEGIFFKLKNNFFDDLAILYEEAGEITKKIEENKERACAECMKGTKSDLIYLFNKLENLRAYVIYKGFQIVI